MFRFRLFLSNLSFEVTLAGYIVHVVEKLRASGVQLMCRTECKVLGTSPAIWECMDHEGSAADFSRLFKKKHFFVWVGSFVSPSD